jgi:hypothetical protein
MHGALACAERLKSQWTTLGVVSALLLTMTFPILVLPTEDMVPDDEVRQSTVQCSTV